MLDATPAANTSTLATETAAPTMSVEERADALFGKEDPESPAAHVAPDGVPASAPATDDEASKARAARRAALAQVQERERARVDATAALRERDELRKRLEAAESSAKAQAQMVDPSTLDEAGFFKLADKLNVTPQKLGEWLRERMANPEMMAERAAKAVVDPEIAALRAEISALKERDAERARLSEEHAQAAAEAHYAAQFTDYARANAATSPITARFIEMNGAEEFIALANSAARDIPPHSGPQAILDEIEERLTRLGALYATTPQRTQAMPHLHQNPAAAKAPTNVTNALAQQRSSVVDEDADFASLPYAERAARIFGS